MGYKVLVRWRRTRLAEPVPCIRCHGREQGEVLEHRVTMPNGEYLIAPYHNTCFTGKYARMIHSGELVRED